MSEDLRAWCGLPDGHYDSESDAVGAVSLHSPYRPIRVGDRWEWIPGVAADVAEAVLPGRADLRLVDVVMETVIGTGEERGFPTASGVLVTFVTEPVPPT